MNLSLSADKRVRILASDLLVYAPAGDLLADEDDDVFDTAAAASNCVQFDLKCYDSRGKLVKVSHHDNALIGYEAQGSYCCLCLGVSNYVL